jgi:hypothetical protein
MAAGGVLVHLGAGAVHGAGSLAVGAGIIATIYHPIVSVGMAIGTVVSVKVR